MEKTCPFCGKKASGNLAFCPYCHKFYDGKERAKVEAKPESKFESQFTQQSEESYTDDTSSKFESGYNSESNAENNDYNTGNYGERFDDDFNSNNNKSAKDGFNFWWCLLAFNIPFIGLVLTLLWHREYPKRARYILIATLLGYAVGFALFYFLLV